MWWKGRAEVHTCTAAEEHLEMFTGVGGPLPVCLAVVHLSDIPSPADGSISHSDPLTPAQESVLWTGVDVALYSDTTCTWLRSRQDALAIWVVHMCSPGGELPGPSEVLEKELKGSLITHKRH